MKPTFLFAILLLLVPAILATCGSKPTLRLYSGYSSSPELRPSVKVVQEKLNSNIGAGLEVDGYFGRATREAVRVYQLSKGLSVDGVVGPQTWASLCENDGGNSGGPSSGGDPPGLLQPFQCKYGNWPARRYTDQIVRPAYNSGGKTYHDLAMEMGVEYGVHPALLTTHMALESQMGLDPKCDVCEQKGKTILTGCMWYPSCSDGCGCNGWAVYSDEDQVKCTAKTDKNASNLKGTYATNCNSYRGDNDKLWKCILCTYQGNVYSDINKKDNDTRYFKKHGTCAYAESFKDVFCEWEAYFSYFEGI